MTTAYGSGGEVSNCRQCGSDTYVAPLHGDRGGPLYCFMCAGAWHAEHGRRRRAGRVVVKAMRGYHAVGGELYGEKFNAMKLAGSGFELSGFGFEDPTGADFADLTSELLAATIALTHPDKHPTERKAEANRVTQELQALKPFVFPAPPPEPPPKPGDGSFNQTQKELNEPSRPAYPCEDCRDGVPADYCHPCKAIWDQKQQKEAEREERDRIERNARARRRYRRGREDWFECQAEPIACATCGTEFEPTRSDKKHCSAACRQRAYLKRDGKRSNARPLDRAEIERAISELFTANPDNAFSTDDLCDRVFPSVRSVDRNRRAAVVFAAKKVSEQRLDEHRSWVPAERRGQPLVFFSYASVNSYGMARLKADWYRADDSDEKFQAQISPGGDHYEYVIKGGAWWKHCQDAIQRAEAAQ